MEMMSQIAKYFRCEFFKCQMPDLLRKSMDWFLYDNGLRHERVKLYFLVLSFTRQNSKYANTKIIYFKFSVSSS